MLSHKDSIVIEAAEAAVFRFLLRRIETNKLSFAVETRQACRPIPAHPNAGLGAIQARARRMS